MAVVSIASVGRWWNLMDGIAGTDSTRDLPAASMDDVRS